MMQDFPELLDSRTENSQQVNWLNLSSLLTAMLGSTALKVKAGLFSSIHFHAARSPSVFEAA
jgi:hypothetical protein